jgi:predicted nucleotide-binding protein
MNMVSAGDTIIEKLERAASTAAFALVIATGDEVGRFAEDDLDFSRNSVFASVMCVKRAPPQR